MKGKKPSFFCRIVSMPFLPSSWVAGEMRRRKIELAGLEDGVVLLDPFVLEPEPQRAAVELVRALGLPLRAVEIARLAKQHALALLERDAHRRRCPCTAATPRRRHPAAALRADVERDAPARAGQEAGGGHGGGERKHVHGAASAARCTRGQQFRASRRRRATRSSLAPRPARVSLVEIWSIENPLREIFHSSRSSSYATSP